MSMLGKHNKQDGLKKLVKRSHNQGSLDTRIIAFVRLMARLAAEEDYRNATPDNQDKGGK